jgi:hypothetical protein
MKRNNCNHPTLNLDTLKTKYNNPLQPISPATLSARWASFIDPSKIPANWAWWETPHGNILDWNRYPDFEKYSRKDKAKHAARQKRLAKKAQRESSIPPNNPMDKAAEYYKYNQLLNTTLKETTYCGPKPKPDLKLETKSALKPFSDGPYVLRTPKQVHFEDELPPTKPARRTKPVTSKLKRTFITLKTKLPSPPTPRAIKCRTITNTRILKERFKAFVYRDADFSDYCPTPTTPEATWFDPVAWREVFVYADGKQRTKLI